MSNLRENLIPFIGPLTYEMHCLLRNLRYDIGGMSYFKAPDGAVTIVDGAGYVLAERNFDPKYRQAFENALGGLVTIARDEVTVVVLRSGPDVDAKAEHTDKDMEDVAKKSDEMEITKPSDLQDSRTNSRKNLSTTSRLLSLLKKFE